MAKREKRNDGYLGIGRGISIILAIIPITSWILGIVQAFRDGMIIRGIFRIIFGFNIAWILDLIWMIFAGRTCHFLFLW